MEAASKKMGRPRAIPDDLREIMASMPGGQSERSRQDGYYRFNVMSLLEEASGCEWLLPSEDEPDNWKPGILAELGRTMMTDGDVTAIEAARQMCAMKPSTKRAIALIREARTGKRPRATAEGVKEASRLAMNNYRSTHSGATLEQLREALVSMLETVENMIDEGGS